MSNSPPETHVRFVPFELIDRHDKVLVGHAGGNDWLVLDPPVAELVTRLDGGTPVEALHGASALLRELETSGFVAGVSPTYAGSNRVSVRRVPRSPWPWRAFAAVTVAALAIGAWALVTDPPGSGDLFASGLPWLLATLLGSTILHELAHVVAARHYGLRPRVTVTPRGPRTDMRGIWALERPLRWRPLAAGMMLDAWLLAAGVLAGAPLLVATAFARLLWQCQAHLRTDVHFLYAALTGAMNLRETTAALLLRRPTRLPRSEVRAGRGYLALLPLAGAASVALAAWMLVPVLG